jgi:pimeloyl-ACP methyl ester carboxylesterase
MLGGPTAAFVAACVFGLASSIGAGCRQQTSGPPLPPFPPMPSSSQSGFVGLNDGQIYYSVFGSGEPVFLLHGGLGHGDMWGAQVAGLSGQFQVIVVDSRGHGRSSPSRHGYSYQLMATDLLGVMDHLHLDEAAIVGWSDGANVAMQMAIHHGHRLSRVVAFGGNIDPEGLRNESNAEFDRYVAAARADYLRLSGRGAQGFAALFNGLKTMWRTQPRFSAEELGAIRTPILVIGAEHDEVVRREHTQAIAKAIPGSTLLTLRDVSHFAFVQQPARFNEAIVTFLGPGGQRKPAVDRSGRESPFSWVNPYTL